MAIDPPNGAAQAPHQPAQRESLRLLIFVPIVVSILTTIVTRTVFDGRTIRLDEATVFFNNYFAKVNKSDADREELRQEAWSTTYRNAAGHDAETLRSIWDSFDEVRPNVFQSDNDNTSGSFQVQLTSYRGSEIVKTNVTYTLACDAFWARWPFYCSAEDLRIKASQTTQNSF